MDPYAYYGYQPRSNGNSILKNLFISLLIVVPIVIGVVFFLKEKKPDNGGGNNNKPVIVKKYSKTKQGSLCECILDLNGPFSSLSDCADALKNDVDCEVKSSKYGVNNERGECHCELTSFGTFDTEEECQASIPNDQTCWKYDFAYVGDKCSCDASPYGKYGTLDECQTAAQNTPNCGMKYQLNFINDGTCNCSLTTQGTYDTEDDCQAALKAKCDTSAYYEFASIDPAGNCHCGFRKLPSQCVNGMDIGNGELVTKCYQNYGSDSTYHSELCDADLNNKVSPWTNPPCKNI